MEGGGWRVEGGGWRVEGSGFGVGVQDLGFMVIMMFSLMLIGVYLVL